MVVFPELLAPVIIVYVKWKVQKKCTKKCRAGVAEGSERWQQSYGDENK